MTVPTAPPLSWAPPLAEPDVRDWRVGNGRPRVAVIVGAAALRSNDFSTSTIRAGVGEAALGVADGDDVADVPVLAVAEAAVLVDVGLEARLGARRGEERVAPLGEHGRLAELHVARVEERLAPVEAGGLGARPARRDVAVGALALARDERRPSWRR